METSVEVQEQEVLEVLSEEEKAELELLEEVIQKGLRTFREVGSALLTIRSKKLYRQKYVTFEAYCQQKWNIDRAYANRLIGATRVAENLASLDVKQPGNESQLRPLTHLEPELQRTA